MGTFIDHYAVLGLRSSATADEIRRAYRILARRYHPDVNPGRSSEEKFKLIAASYAVLADADSRRQYDHDFLEQLKRSKAEHFARTQRRTARGRAEERYRTVQEATQRNARAAQETFAATVRSPLEQVKQLWSRARAAVGNTPRSAPRGRKVSVIEISVTLRDAIQGVRRTIELAEPEGVRKISVSIPAGIRTGSVIRLREKDGVEELVLIVRVSSHPHLALDHRGLVVEIPITVSEALHGASLTLPTFESHAVVKVPPGSQSGTEIRLKQRGIL